MNRSADLRSGAAVSLTLGPSPQGEGRSSGRPLLGSAARFKPPTSLLPLPGGEGRGEGKGTFRTTFLFNPHWARTAQRRVLPGPHVSRSGRSAGGLGPAAHNRNSLDAYCRDGGLLRGSSSPRNGTKPCGYSGAAVSLTLGPSPQGEGRSSGRPLLGSAARFKPPTSLLPLTGGEGRGEGKGTFRTTFLFNSRLHP
jgi:hypothetical protein